MKNPILVNSPGESMQASYQCLPISLILRGLEFKVSPIVLRRARIDLIMGLDWMKQNQAVIQCKEKAVALITPKGDRISAEAADSYSESAW
jgi:hypothetical protein